jgi:hypothetical protein
VHDFMTLTAYGGRGDAVESRFAVANIREENKRDDEGEHASGIGGGKDFDR